MTVTIDRFGRDYISDQFASSYRIKTIWAIGKNRPSSLTVCCKYVTCGWGECEAGMKMLCKRGFANEWRQFIGSLQILVQDLVGSVLSWAINYKLRIGVVFWENEKGGKKKRARKLNSNLTNRFCDLLEKLTGLTWIAMYEMISL